MVELQRLLWLSSPILDWQVLLQLLQINSVLGSVGALSSHPTALFSSPHRPALSASLQWFRHAAIASQCVGLILPAFRSRLQTTLKRRLGHPTGLVPVVSFLYSMSLGICPSLMRFTCPSQPSRLWLSKANMLGNPACATTSLLGTKSCEVIPKILLKQRSGKCWVCTLGRSRGSRSCYYRVACSARRPGILSSCCWWST